MKNTFSSLGFNAIISASALALTMSLATNAMAQVTTSSVRGSVFSNTGAPVSSASLTLSNSATGLTRNVQSDVNGNFSIRNLPVSGSYDITVNAPGLQSRTIEGLRLSLGQTAQVDIELSSVGDEVIATAMRTPLADIALGPNATFGALELENAPAINRNISDIIRLDPRVFVDESRGGINSIQCVGQNSRFNSLTVDGVALNDSFGLNSNGFPTERQPFPYEILDQVSVEIAPFDVKYGSFTACNINAVTKSGTNELHGGAFIDYTNNNLRGNQAKGTTVEFDEFDEIRYGFDIGGPIVKDKLFFYAAYEKLEGANTYDSSVIGTGDFQVSQADLNEIAEISRDIYQYDPGFTPTSNDNADEKIFVKLDWNITDAHRASFSYNYNQHCSLRRR
jgi:outer membrane receptor for ferrienterochelin and colicin